MKNIYLAAIALLMISGSAYATTGPGCLRVVNVASWDTLNIRAKPSASSAIVGKIDPDYYGIIALRGACTPKSLPWGQRWCPIVSYHEKTVKGWVKARFVRDSECP
jgi:hypothetical protein